MVQTFDPRSWEAEAGGSVSLRTAWSTKSLKTASAVNRETLSEKKTTKKKLAQCVLMKITAHLRFVGYKSKYYKKKKKKVTVFQKITKEIASVC